MELGASESERVLVGRVNTTSDVSEGGEHRVLGSIRVGEKDQAGHIKHRR